MPDSFFLQISLNLTKSLMSKVFLATEIHTNELNNMEFTQNDLVTTANWHLTESDTPDLQLHSLIRYLPLGRLMALEHCLQ
jgi:hypothetical protein